MSKNKDGTEKPNKEEMKARLDAKKKGANNGEIIRKHGTD